MNKQINDMLMSHFFGKDWEEAFADPVRKAAIDKKLKDKIELNRAQEIARQREEEE